MFNAKTLFSGLQRSEGRGGNIQKLHNSGIVVVVAGGWVVCGPSASASGCALRCLCGGGWAGHRGLPVGGLGGGDQDSGGHGGGTHRHSNRWR